MKRRTRYDLWMVVAAVAGLVYPRISRDWSFADFHAGFAGVVALIVIVGILRVEFASDGDLRRRPQS